MDRSHITCLQLAQLRHETYLEMVANQQVWPSVLSVEGIADPSASITCPTSSTFYKLQTEAALHYRAAFQVRKVSFTIDARPNAVSAVKFPNGGRGDHGIPHLESTEVCHCPAALQQRVCLSVLMTRSSLSSPPTIRPGMPHSPTSSS